MIGANCTKHLRAKNGTHWTTSEHQADTRHRLIFAEHALLEDGLTPAQIRDHMRRHADIIDEMINQPEGDAE